jgi:hypothetical protein
MVSFKKLRRIFDEKGSGNIITKTIQVEPFLQLHLCTHCTVEIVQAAEEKVVVETDDNLIDHIRVDNSIKTLYITPANGMKTPLYTFGKITVYCKSLEAIYMTSHGDMCSLTPIVSDKPITIKTVSHGDITLDLQAPVIRLTTTNHGDLALKCSGESLQINNVSKGDLNIVAKVSTVEINNKGRGDILLKGECDALSISNMGHGDIEAGDLESHKVQIDNSGHGDVIVRASESIGINNSGHGDIVCYGTGEMTEVTHAGHGKIVRKGDR